MKRIAKVETPTVWIKFECYKGNRWTEVKGREQSKDGDFCNFSGCSGKHKIHIKGEFVGWKAKGLYKWFRRV